MMKRFCFLLILSALFVNSHAQQYDGNILKGTFSQGDLVDGMQYSVSGISAVPIKTERTLVDDDVMYVGNKKSMRFHYPTCRSVDQMKEKNKVFFHSREEAVEANYIPCGDCNP